MGNVIEFISYEGSFVAASGPAAGLTSTNVGVGIFEGGTANGTAIGRVGTGDEAADFSWALIADDTPGGVNVGQTFEGGVVITASVDDVCRHRGQFGHDRRRLHDHPVGGEQQTTSPSLRDRRRHRRGGQRL